MENILVAGIRSGQSEFLDPALEPLDSTRKKEKDEAFGVSMAVYKRQEFQNWQYCQVREGHLIRCVFKDVLSV